MVSVPHPRAGARPLVQRVALTFGVIFLVVGVLGFIPGITTNYGSMTFAGHHSGALLLGIFQVSILHNIVHVLFGLAGVAMSRDSDTARLYLIGGGAVYLALWLYGLVINLGSPANFIPVNNPDNWLHFILGAAMIGLGIAATRRAHPDRR
ncbi:DUF4383 domain-containing protein [Planosporangium mesophilum]|uniref:Membrane protein n=1 Tax=Planosporangium mesophilum TaxID=689768 RepID=A0A8J3T982_9ACTN|nr:DUF4383 domain-containing protein [Planosporangium mesophilum]NJC81452.1 DUF4383 domain-containing protein [Planosporangium mesophilum]GII20891.1 membrane protein [Planosporangium mesophilum]